MTVMKWLLDGDPAIRWQVMRDLLGAPPEQVAEERARVAVQGWGAQLLASQAEEGQWGARDDDGWMTTVYALVMLGNLGADPASEPVKQTIGRVAEGVTWYQLDGRPFFEGETEPCINGGILAAGARLGVSSERLVERLLSEQLEDGGWNCDAPASRRSSFHSTICVVEGLLAYEQARGGEATVAEARARAQEYLLERQLLRSLRTGELLDRKWTRFSFPPSWRYDVLRGLDYLRAAGVNPDDRAAEAITVVRQRRHQNGRWPMNLVHSSPLHFPLEPGVGRASRWNTLRALRVLKWAEAPRHDGPQQRALVDQAAGRVAAASAAARV